MRDPTILLNWRVAIPIVAVCCLATVAGADTYGLPPFMVFEKEWRADSTDLEDGEVFVVRSSHKWKELWARHGSEPTAGSDVDFDRFMVVGIVSREKEGLAIYRIQLDDGRKPGALIVRAARNDAFCQIPRRKELKGSKVHMVMTGKSALPVRFVLDRVVDARVFDFGGGVDVTTLAEVRQLGQKPKTTLRADGREEAEYLAVSALFDEEIEVARKHIWPQPAGENYPDLWSVINVERLEDHWLIDYDCYSLTVDVKSGDVTRIPVRATLEQKPHRPGWFTIQITNTSDETIRFIDIPEGAGDCGRFYEVAIAKNGKRSLSSPESCHYAPYMPPKRIELEPGETHNRDIQPGAYFLNAEPLVPPYEISVAYRMTEEVKERWRSKSDEVDLDFTFQTREVKIEERKE